MRLALGIILILSGSAHAEPRWKPDGLTWHRVVVTTTAPTIQVVDVDARPLCEGRKAMACTDLYRNRETGALSCVVRTTTRNRTILEHEYRHCHGWSHRE